MAAGIHLSDLARWRSCPRAYYATRSKDVASMQAVPNAALLNAAQVLSRDTRIVEWLGENDPKALAQLRAGIRDAQALADREVALRALDERFGGILDVTFLEPEQEAAILALFESVCGTLMTRGRERLSEKLGADAGRLLASYQTAVREKTKTTVAATLRKARA